MNTGPIRSASGKSISRRLGKSSDRLADSRMDQRIRPVEPREPDLELLERVERLGLEAVGQHLHHLLARADRACHRPGVIEARREREDAVERHEPVARLEADDPAARGRDPDRTAGVRAERVLREPRRDRRRRAAARASGHASRDTPGSGTVPKCGLTDVIPYANSCRFVLPTFAYPAASRRVTASALCSGTWSA